MSTQHTPGPWIALPHTEPQWKICRPDNEFRVIATTAQANDEANARLIAVAPEMLQLAYAVVDYFGGPGETTDSPLHNLAVHVIAKAEGR